MNIDKHQTATSSSLEVGAAPSFQVYQDVYNRLTGRTEKIRRLFFDKQQVTLEHILNLNATIEQGVEQYTCHSSTASISVYYVDGTSERWSSFERFRMQAPTKSSCVESVEIEYDFLLTLPKLEDPRPYKLVIGMRSEVGFQKKLDLENASTFDRKMADNMKMGTARLSISYVDLVVARSFEAFVTSWYSALPRVSEGFTQRLIRLFSPASGLFTRLLIVITASVLCYVALAKAVVDVPTLFKFGLFSAVFLMISNILSFKIGDFVSGILSSFSPLSHVRLSDSDDIAKSEQGKKSLKRAVIVITSWLGIVGTGLVINYLSKFLI
jgi:hypothetical protein